MTTQFGSDEKYHTVVIIAVIIQMLSIVLNKTLVCVSESK